MRRNGAMSSKQILFNFQNVNVFFIVNINQMQDQKRIPRLYNNTQQNQQHHRIIGRQAERITSTQRQLLQSYSVGVKTKSEGSLQLSGSSVQSRKANKKIELKQSLQFVLQQDDHAHHLQQLPISKPAHSKQIQTSLNFIALALDNHQFPEAKTEIANFIRQAKKFSHSYDPQIKLLCSVSNISTFIENSLNETKSHQQLFSEINKSLQLANKFFRQGKWFQLQKVKLKLLQNKSSKLQLTVGLFLQSIICNDSKAKSKQSSKSTLIRPKEKQQKQKVTDMEMDSLRKEISKLTVQLQREKGKSSNIKQQKEVRSGSIQKGRRYQSERVSMLQKKCLMLQLQIDSKSQQVQSCMRRIRQLQNQLSESLANIERLHKPKNQLQHKQQSPNLQTDKQDDSLLKKLEVKDQRILQLQQTLRKVNGDSIGLQLFLERELRMQQSEKDMEIIRLKKQIIELLQQQTHSNTYLPNQQLQQQTYMPNQQLHSQNVNPIHQPQLKDTNQFNNLQDIVSKWVSYQATIKKLQSQNDQSTREIQSLRRQLSLSRRQYEELERQLRESMNQIGHRESGSENQEQSGEQMRVMNVLNANYNSLQVEMRAISYKVNVLVGEKEALTKLIHEQESTIQEQRHAIQQQNQHKSNQELMKKRQLQALSLQIANLQQQLTEQQRQNSQLSQKNKHLQTSLRTNNQNNKIQMFNLQQQHAQSMLKLNRHNQQLKTKIQQLLAENGRLINVQNIHKDRVEQLLADINQMRQREILNNNQSTLHTQSINQTYNKSLIAAQKDKAQLKQQILNLQKHNQILTMRCQTLTNNFKSMVANYESKLAQQIKTKQQGIKIISQHLLLKEQQLNFKNQQLRSLYEEVNIGKGKLAQKISQFERLNVKFNQSEHEKTQLTHALQIHQKEFNASISNAQTTENEQLKLQLQSLTIQLSKESAQKQLLKQQLYNSQQNSMKAIAELRQQNRKLSQYSNSLTNQNVTISNQLSTYKSTIKQMRQQIISLQQQLTAIKLQRDKQQIRLKGQIQNLINTINQQKQKATAKDNQIVQLNLQHNLISKQLHASTTILKDQQFQFNQLKEKSKQIQMSLKGKLQLQQLNHTKQKNQLVSKLNDLKQDSHKAKGEFQVMGKELEVMGRELIFLKSLLQKKQGQNLYLNQQVSSLNQTISSIKTNYQTQVSSLKHQIQSLSTHIKTHQSQQTNSYKTNLQQIEKLLQITTNKLNQSLADQANLSHQINKLNKYTSQLETLLQEKIKQIARIGRELINLQIKAKETQRKAKYEFLHLKAQFDAINKSKQQIQQSCNRLSSNYCRIQQQCRIQQEKNQKLLQSLQMKLLQNQSLQQQISTLQFAKQQNTSLIVLQQQLTNIKSQHSKTLLINQQLNQQLVSAKKRSQDLMMVEMELERVNKDLASARKDMEKPLKQNQQLNQSNHQLAQQLDQAKQQLLQIHQEMSKLQQHFNIQLQSYRNSQRVLDNQLIQYKSRLQNLSQSLRQENQRSSELRQEIQKLRVQKNITQKELYLKSQQSAQEQNYLRREITRLQRELQQSRNTISQHHKTLLQTHAHQLTQRDEQISYLNQQLLNLTQQNSHFHLNHSLLYQNPQYHQQYSIDQRQQHQTHENISFFIDQRSQLEQQQKQQLEYDLLLQVQSKIQILVEENNMLKQKLYHKDKLFIS